MENIGMHRPRNLGWARAAALLYGDWGTSKAYVIGFAFLAAGFSSFPIILAVCALTGLVAYNYIIVCKNFPDGGGVYSAAREQSRVLAVLGSLLLVANFTVTASMSGWAAINYFGVTKEHLTLLKFAAVGCILLVGAINYFGPKHSGSIAMFMALPMVLVVVVIIALSVPHLTLTNLQPMTGTFRENWVAFVGVILALSGVEAIANLTGVMKLDKGATPEKPSVLSTARKSIWPVAAEVVFGTALLAWAMLSLPHSLTDTLKQRADEDMVKYLGEHYGELAFGPHFGSIFGVIIGLVVGVLLLSAVNTAVSALIGLIYMLARDREMPVPFTKLNSHGVPLLPLLVATALPILLVLTADSVHTLAALYAIGVVGAITVNLGSCCFNRRLKLRWWDRGIMVGTFLILFCVELTIAKTSQDALFFIACVLGVGFALRWWAMTHAGFETIIIRREFAAAVSHDTTQFRPNLTPGQSILVAARGLTPVLRFAVEEAKFRQGNLYVLYIKELAVNLPGPLAKAERPRWQDDHDAAKIMYAMVKLGQEIGVPVIPVFVVSENPAATILDISATIGADVLMLGSSHRTKLVHLLKGNVITEVAKNLPENIQLVIHS